MYSEEFQLQTNNNSIPESDLVEKARLEKANDDAELQELLKGMKKKRRKPKKEETTQEEENQDASTEAAASVSVDNGPNYDYLNSLLPRFYEQLYKDYENQGLSNTDKKIVKPITPVTVQVGGKKIKFSNYEKFTKSFQTRNIELRMKHMQEFLQKELVCTGNLANSVLTLYSRIKPDRVNNVVKSYLLNYAKCETCGNLNTIIDKCQISNYYNIKCECCRTNPRCLNKF